MYIKTPGRIYRLGVSPFIIFFNKIYESPFMKFSIQSLLHSKKTRKSTYDLTVIEPSNIPYMASKTPYTDEELWCLFFECLDRGETVYYALDIELPS